MLQATDAAANCDPFSQFVFHPLRPSARCCPVLEQEDNLIRLDRTLARLFEHLEQNGLLEDTLVVLTADHGVDEIPESRDPDVCPQGRATPEAFVPALDAHLQTVFRTGDTSLIRSAERYRNPYIYLDIYTVAQFGLSIADVEDAACAFVEQQPGTLAAYPRHAIVSEALGDALFADQVYRSYNPARSGNLHLMAQPHWFLNNSSTQGRATHGSPHAYDAHVPLIIYGMGVTPGSVDRQVGLSDLAPTLAHLLSTASPSMATGTPLTEVVGTGSESDTMPR